MASQKKSRPIAKGIKGNAKIDSYFKPSAKINSPVGSQKRPAENDFTCYNDENMHKKPNTTSATKRTFGEIKPAGLKEAGSLRVPLMDKIPRTVLGSKTAASAAPRAKRPSSSRQKPAAFSVLCDKEIEEGVEKASTPPTVSQTLRDSQDSLLNSQNINASQDTTSSQNSCSRLKNDLNTQFIPESGDVNTQWTEVTSSPIDLYYEHDRVSHSPLEIQVFVDSSQDERDTRNSLKEIKKRDEKMSRFAERYQGKENEPPVSTSNTQDPEDSIDFGITDEEDEDEDELSLFPTTTPAAIPKSMSPTILKKSDDEVDGFSDDNEEEFLPCHTTTAAAIPKSMPPSFKKSTTKMGGLFSDDEEEENDDDNFDVGPNFFSDDEDEVGEEKANNKTKDDTGSTFFEQEEAEPDFVEPGMEFSIAQLETTPAESLTNPIDDYTLSLDVAEPISQIHVPWPNPRGKGIMEQLGYDDKKTESENETETTQKSDPESQVQTA